MEDSGRAPSGQALAVPVEPVSRLDPLGFDPSRKPRVTVAQCRLLAHLWPYAKRYAANADRAQIISDIFDGWFTREEVKPLVKGGLALEEHFYDPSDIPRHFHTWILTPVGERAVFGPAGRAKSRW